MAAKTSVFQQALEAVEALSINDQAILLEVLHKRLIQQRQERLLLEVRAAEQDYAQGNVKCGLVADFMTELDN